MFLYGNIRFILRFTLGFVLRLNLRGWGLQWLSSKAVEAESNI